LSEFGRFAEFLPYFLLCVRCKVYAVYYDSIFLSVGADVLM